MARGSTRRTTTSDMTIIIQRGGNIGYWLENEDWWDEGCFTNNDDILTDGEMETTVYDDDDDDDQQLAHNITGADG